MEDLIVAATMVSVEDAVLAGLSLVASVLYFVVARAQARRRVSPEAKPARDAFIVWWAGLGVLGLVTVFFTLGPSVEEQGIWVVRAIIYGLFLGIFAMLTGLVYYLLYLYTGRPGGFYVAGAFYAVMFLLLVWLVEAHAPHVAEAGVHAGEEPGRRFHNHEEPPTWGSLALGIGLILPPLAAAIAYAMLFFRTTDRTARYRIALVSIGFVLWFGFSLVGTIARAVAEVSEQSFAGRVTSQVLGLLAAVLVLLAYEPPRLVRERLGLRSIEQDAHGSREVFQSPPRTQGTAA